MDVGADLGGGGGPTGGRRSVDRPQVKAATGGWGFDGGNDDAPAPAPVRVDTRASQGGGGGRNHWNDDVEEQVIPELEDELQEDITTKVAAPPVHRSVNLQGARELNQGVSAPMLTHGDEDIDLAILWQHLCTEKQVTEADLPWENEALFQEVSSEVTKTNAEDSPEEPETDGGSNTVNNAGS